MRRPRTSADRVATMAVDTETRFFVSSVRCSAGRSFLSFQPANAPAEIRMKTTSPAITGLCMTNDRASVPSWLTYPERYIWFRRFEDEGAAMLQPQAGRQRQSRSGNRNRDLGCGTKTERVGCWCDDFATRLVLIDPLRCRGA